MFTIISIALGVSIGLLLTMAIACAIMCNLKVLVWFTERYLKSMEKLAESLTKKMGL